MTRASVLTLTASFAAGMFCTEAFFLLRPSSDEMAPASSAPSVAPQPLREPTIEEHPASAAQLTSFSPLPEVFERAYVQPDRDAMALGRMFFFDKRFSRNHDTACSSCHPLAQYGMDGRGVSIGHLGQSGRRNAPTVYNAGGSGLQFWDGRAREVESQALMPLLDPFEMAMTRERVVQTMKSIPEYVDALHQVFPDEADPVTFQNFGIVVGAFERGLVTPSRWDRYLAGDELALSEVEKEGFGIFTQLGCPNCHAGQLIGGTHIEVLGAAWPWPNQTDLGQNQLQPGSINLPMFKVASLRNVAMTAPYFHDASSDTLEDAVRRMGKHQLGLKLSKEHIDPVVAWLKSLTGALPLQYIEPPALPPSTVATPKPQRDGY